MQSRALAELENVQLGKPSEFWSLRHEQPLLLQNWQELALAFTAWSWMDKELQPPTALVWKQLWDKALSWPIENELAYVEQAVNAWSDYPIWNSTRCMKLIRAMESAQPRDWSSLILPEDLKPQRFSYHLLNAVCFNMEKFSHLYLPNIWALVMNSSLRGDVKEMQLVGLLNSSDEQWAQMKPYAEAQVEPHLVGDGLLRILQERFAHRAEWLTNLVTLQDASGLGQLRRQTLANQWHLLLNKNQWEKEAKSYEMVDFSEGSPEFF